MDKTVIRHILTYWRSEYYLSVVALVCQTIAMIKGIAYYRNKREGKFLLIYISSWLLTIVFIRYAIEYIRHVGNNNDLSIIIEETNYVVVSIIEYGCFSYFLSRLFASPKNKALVKIFTVLLIIPVLIFIHSLWLGNSAKVVRHLSFTISSIEMFLLAILCLIYFYELFQRASLGNLSEKPSFWIITALLLYCILVVPFFLVADKFITYNRIVLNIGFTIHLISFSVLFLAITKAFSLGKSLIA